ncbi:hypothetical protein [Mycoplasma leonicaptivi]|uniref:hypothetical protein n=1 Tax=Mycoplasma leonicaptivi TaxID=36742 RepID=UPI00048388A5|nr:hypothetical protein [Mycoplasma leonicaptivi]
MLSNNSFYIYDQNNLVNYHVPCSFYIWTKEKTIQKDLRKTKPKQPKEFIFLKRNSIDADFVLNGNSGKIKDLSQITNPKSEHYIKVNSNFDKKEIIDILKKIKFSKYSSVNGGNYWINQSDICEAWEEYKNEETN